MAQRVNGYEEWLEQCQERELTQWLQYAEEYAMRWLRRRNGVSASPLCEQDLEDIISEVRIAVLRFKLPEHAECWKPCLTGYVQRVCERAYARAVRTRGAHMSLEVLPENMHPQIGIPMEHLDDEQFVCCLAAVLQAMPVHHAAAFVLSLDTELALTLVRWGALNYAHAPWARLAPLPDKAIASVLNLTPRAVIRARQHAREKLKKTLTQAGEPA
ncbi:MAG: hypothetical protein KatS3mg019_0496 [Fimbriimonadales bacterium]|nr:MAG: hypothetical protein KatS3mg019_0496 [Fimbriimonadales bacterium]